VGDAGVALDGVGPEQEDLRDNRGLAQSSDRGRAPYVYLDGIVLKRSWAGEVRNVSLLVAINFQKWDPRYLILTLISSSRRRAWASPIMIKPPAIVLIAAP
jgi:hypothetical protein